MSDDFRVKSKNGDFLQVSLVHDLCVGGFEEPTLMFIRPAGSPTFLVLQVSQFALSPRPSCWLPPLSPFPPKSNMYEVHVDTLFFCYEEHDMFFVE